MHDVCQYLLIHTLQLIHQQAPNLKQIRIAGLLADVQVIIRRPPSSFPC